LKSGAWPPLGAHLSEIQRKSACCRGAAVFVHAFIRRLRCRDQPERAFPAHSIERLRWLQRFRRPHSIRDMRHDRGRVRLRATLRKLALCHRAPRWPHSIAASTVALARPLQAKSEKILAKLLKSSVVLL
jgi:hypothetical protein